MKYTTTKGKCVTCKTIWTWIPGKGKEVQNAFCPECDGKLERTCAEPKGYVWVDRRPFFSASRALKEHQERVNPKTTSAEPQDPKVRRCEVVEDHSGRNAVLTEDGEKIFLATLWSPRYPVGTKGTIEYKRGPSYGIYVFKLENEEEQS